MWLKKLLRVEPVKPKEDNLNYFFQIKKRRVNRGVFLF